MAWRKPTERDLAATLSQEEIDKFRRSFPDGDPVGDILLRTAELVRGHCRSNRSLMVSPEAGTLPESLISPAMDYAAFDILKRMPLKINDERRMAREAAEALFGKVADGKVTPEDAEDGSGTRAGPSFADPHPPRLLD